MEIKLTEEERNLKITSPEKIYPIFQKIYEREEYLGLKREYFWVVGLDYAGTLLYIELVSLGSANRVAVRPGDVYQLALLRNAETILLVHNHPSGGTKFSPQDLDITDRLIQVGKIHDIYLADHLIITEETFVGLRSLGLYEELYNSKKHLTPYIEYEIALKQIEKKAKIEYQKTVAVPMHKMDDQGKSWQEIAEFFGITPKDVERILYLY